MTNASGCQICLVAFYDGTVSDSSSSSSSSKGNEDEIIESGVQFQSYCEPRAEGMRDIERRGRLVCASMVEVQGGAAVIASTLQSQGWG